MALCKFEEAISGEKMEIYDRDDNTIARGFFSDIRVDRRTLPEGWHAYDFREGDEGEWLGTLEENYVYVNHAGTFLTQDAIQFPNSHTCPDGSVSHWANMKSSPEECEFEDMTDEDRKAIEERCAIWDFDYSFV